MLPIIKPALLSMLQPHVCLISYSRPPCSRLMTSHHVTCHVTVVSHASSSSKRKIKEKEKEDQYKIRKIKEKKKKNC